MCVPRANPGVPRPKRKGWLRVFPNCNYSNLPTSSSPAASISNSGKRYDTADHKPDRHITKGPAAALTTNSEAGPHERSRTARAKQNNNAADSTAKQDRRITLITTTGRKPHDSDKGHQLPTGERQAAGVKQDRNREENKTEARAPADNIPQPALAALIPCHH